MYVNVMELMVASLPALTHILRQDALESLSTTHRMQLGLRQEESQVFVRLEFLGLYLCPSCPSLCK